MEKKRESKIENPEEMLSLDKLVPNAGGKYLYFGAYCDAALYRNL